MLHDSITPSNFERFWSKVDTSAGVNGCWPREGSLTGCGYPQFTVAGRSINGHRFAFVSIFGDPPPHLPKVLHKCPGGGHKWCVNLSHLAPGTVRENAADAIADGTIARGDRHASRTKPERLARGDRNGSRLRPERLARGDRSGARVHPESLIRGEAHHKAKLAAPQVQDIRAAYAAGGVTAQQLATQHGVTKQNILAILHRETWRHVV